MIEGIGRPRVEPSFIPALIDRAIAVTDTQSIGAARALSRHLGRLCGGSTGTNLWAAAQVLTEMHEGAIATLLCDSGERYRGTYFDDAWLAAHGVNPAPAEAAIEHFFETGRLPA